jgi:hypothetical protein
LERQDLKSRLNDILMTLPSAQRQTTVLHYYNGLKAEEIAYVMGCSLNTALSRMRLARSAIRARIEDEERKSGEKFYGFVPMIPLGQAIDAHFSSLATAEEAASAAAGVMAAIDAATNASAASNPTVFETTATNSGETNSAKARKTFPRIAKAIAAALALLAIFLGGYFAYRTLGGNQAAPTPQETAKEIAPLVPEEPETAPAAEEKETNERFAFVSGDWTTAASTTTA